MFFVNASYVAARPCASPHFFCAKYGFGVRPAAPPRKRSPLRLAAAANLFRLRARTFSSLPPAPIAGIFFCIGDGLEPAGSAVFFTRGYSCGLFPGFGRASARTSSRPAKPEGPGGIRPPSLRRSPLPLKGIANFREGW